MSTQESKFAKRYIGDGVFVEYDGFGLKLTAENGYRTTDTIYIEPSVWVALKKYADDVKKTLSSRKE